MSERFEQMIKKKLLADVGGDKGKAYVLAYEVAREKVVNDVLPEILRVEPELTDHSRKHVENVLANARHLVAGKKKVTSLSAIDLYCLATFILFHDVGNVHGRTDHQKRVGEIFDWVRGSDPKIRHERLLVVRATKAHAGQASDGTPDTLREIAETDHLNGHAVKLQELAAILRFADELAEGPQRTSRFRDEIVGYDNNAQIFHDYASITNIHIDRENERVRVTYDIDIAKRPGESNEDRDNRLGTLLTFTYARIKKLDQERKYARYYSSDVLAPFRMTSVEFNFSCRHEILPYTLPPLQLDDKVVPGADAPDIELMGEEYRIDGILRQLATFEAEVTER